MVSMAGAVSLNRNVPQGEGPPHRCKILELVLDIYLAKFITVGKLQSCLLLLYALHANLAAPDFRMLSDRKALEDFDDTGFNCNRFIILVVGLGRSLSKPCC